MLSYAVALVGQGGNANTIGNGSPADYRYVGAGIVDGHHQPQHLRRISRQRIGDVTQALALNLPKVQHKATQSTGALGNPGAAHIGRQSESGDRLLIQRQRRVRKPQLAQNVRDTIE